MYLCLNRARKATLNYNIVKLDYISCVFQVFLLPSHFHITFAFTTYSVVQGEGSSQSICWKLNEGFFPSITAVVNFLFTVISSKCFYFIFIWGLQILTIIGTKNKNIFFMETFDEHQMLEQFSLFIVEVHSTNFFRGMHSFLLFTIWELSLWGSGSHFKYLASNTH